MSSSMPSLLFVVSSVADTHRVIRDSSRLNFALSRDLCRHHLRPRLSLCQTLLPLPLPPRPDTCPHQYDYPSDLAENLTEVGHQAQAAWASFANKNLKNTSVPIPIPAEKQTEHLPKTLPHALSRAALSGAAELGAEERLGAALGTYAAATQKVSRRVR